MRNEEPTYRSFWKVKISPTKIPQTCDNSTLNYSYEQKANCAIYQVEDASYEQNMQNNIKTSRAEYLRNHRAHTMRTLAEPVAHLLPRHLPRGVRIGCWELSRRPVDTRVHFLLRSTEMCAQPLSITVTGSLPRHIETTPRITCRDMCTWVAQGAKLPIHPHFSCATPAPRRSSPARKHCTTRALKS